MKINHYVAVVDACVLAPMPIADTVLRLAEETFFTPKWSAEILGETKRTLIKFGYSEVQSERRLVAMTTAFPEAMVEGYEDLIPAMTNHVSDRHVLAAGVRSQAHCIVSNNTKHFNPDSLRPYDLECLSADSFLVHQYHLDTDAFISLIEKQARSIQKSTADLLQLLSVHVPKLASLIRPSRKHISQY